MFRIWFRLNTCDKYRVFVHNLMNNLEFVFPYIYDPMKTRYFHF